MFVSRQEKEKLVLDLYYNQGKTFRDIAKEVRMSFSDISFILKKKEAEEEEEKNNINKNRPRMLLRVFEIKFEGPRSISES
jgi:transposase